MRMMKPFWVFVFLLTVFHCACGLYDGKSDVIELTSTNFKGKVLESDSIWMVEFYAPWCGHCQSFAPEYSKAAKALKGLVKVGGVNMDEHGSLGDPYGVDSFPTVKIFGLDKKKPYEYDGPPSARGLIDKAVEEVKKVANDRLSGKTAESGKRDERKKGGEGTNDGKKEKEKVKEKKKGDAKDVIELTDSNFDSMVLNSEDMWMVEFYSPRCGQCKELKPHWEKAATELKGRVKLGAVDATIHHHMAHRFGIQGFPGIKMFPLGKKSRSSVVDYNGGHTSQDIVNWAKENLAESLPPPEVVQLTSDAVLKEACGNRPMCILSFLPHILDCQSKCRNEYLQILRELTKKYKKKMWGWAWAEASSQAGLEETVSVGGFGYPAMAAVNQKKGKYAVLKGSFSLDGMNEFLRDMSYGRGASMPLKTKGMELPEIGTVEPWDGKDAEPPKEEEVDLSDVELENEEL